MLKFKISYLSKIYIMINHQKLFSKKTFIILGFVAFSLFWFGDFMWAFFYMIVFPIVFYIQQKNRSKIKNITENHPYVAFTTLTILIAYIGFMAQYLSIQNPNKAFDSNQLAIDTYYIPKYKSVRTRSDSVLLVENNQGYKSINCSAFTYGRCPYAHQYGDYIDIGFVSVRKSFSRFIYGIDNARIAYYIKYKDEIISSDYFFKKYNDEMKKVYFFLISLNLYILLLFYIKISYGFNLSKSFHYVFSKTSDLAHCLFLVILVFLQPIIKFFYYIFY